MSTEWKWYMSFPANQFKSKGESLALFHPLLKPEAIFFFFLLLLIFFKFYFIFKLYSIVLVLPNIKMNPPQVYLCSPSWTLLPPPSPYPPSGEGEGGEIWENSSETCIISCMKPFFKLAVWQPDRIACSTARLGPWMTRWSWILCWPALDVSIPRSQEVSYPWDLGNLFGILTNTVGVLGSYLAGPLLFLIGFCICFMT